MIRWLSIVKQRLLELCYRCCQLYWKKMSNTVTFQESLMSYSKVMIQKSRPSLIWLVTKVKVNLEKQFPDTTKVKFEVTPPVFDDLLRNFDTTVDDGIETTAEEKGDGMQRALMLAIIQTFAEFRKEGEDEGKSFLFFIDEAELHLHPTAQRNLKNVLHELSESNDQVFINTHSSVFVADNFPNQKIFKAEKNEGETEIEPTDDITKPYIVYELLGGSPSDLLLQEIS